MDNDQSYPAVNPSGAPGRTGARTQGQATPQMSPEDDDEGLALGEIIAVLIDYRWLIAAITLFALVLGLAWIFIAKPVYRADGLL
ncbi:MAG: capsular biosynthesis protein, partial [Candidatus Accumulibacter sp.]|nr:capsular biosynthesis protein [Accumulibacter sp.]